MSKPKVAKAGNVPEDLLLDLLTPSEVRMVKNRWKIINMIDEGYPVRHIAGVAKVGTDTVVRMSKKITQNLKLRQYFNRGRNTYRPLQSSKWVFGQVGKEKEL